jgi:hypothetical protein
MHAYNDPIVSCPHVVAAIKCCNQVLDRIERVEAKYAKQSVEDRYAAGWSRWAAPDPGSISVPSMPTRSRQRVVAGEITYHGDRFSTGEF